MIAQILDHLWQSTVILCLAGLLTLLLRKNSAAARYSLWFAASVKFLIPLSLLTALSSRLRPLPAVPMLSAQASALVERVSEPFVQGASFPGASAVGAAAAPAVNISTVLLIIWGAGCGVVLLSWFTRWRRVQRTLSLARPLSLEAPIPVRESGTSIEPGLVGICSPVILLPAGLAQRLALAEIRGILAHELCHYRRRDNLTAAAHMLVEALFWFYPPIWWLGARLIAERERACDESVLAAGNDAELYAESILKVCRFFRQSSIACAAGVSGGVLSRRVEEIMTGRGTLPVGRAKKIIVTISIAGALVGMASCSQGSRRSFAQTQVPSATVPTPAERAKLLEEQTRPQKEVSFNPADFDKFVGYSKLSPSVAFAHMYRIGNHFYTQLTDQRPVEVFPESPTEFFATVVAAQWSFVTGADGQVTETILHQNGYLRPWLRSTKSANDAFEINLAQRVKENKPSPGTEASLRRFITSWVEKGQPNYDDMEPAIAEVAREQAPRTAHIVQQLGAFESLKFVRVNPMGMDIYLGTFTNGQAEFTIAPLDANGKVVGRGWRVLP